MPDPTIPLRVLVLNASLKHAPQRSNTEELARNVLRAMKHHGRVKAEIIRLADCYIPVGLSYREGKGDEWPSIVRTLKQSDIVIFATPIWWGQRSSLMQRVIERLDALDEEYKESGRSVLLNKVAGVVITGSEDGAQQTLGSILEVLLFFGFTIPPEAATYWVGEVGMPPAKDAAKRRRNAATNAMTKTMARNLMYYAQLLKLHPLTPKQNA